MKKAGALAVVVCLAVAVNIACADTIRGINIDFVNIGHAGNTGDIRGESAPVGCGAVGYNYRIGKYEITNAQWDAFTTAAGVPTGNPSSGYDQSAFFTGAQQPTNNASWYEAAQFCNYLTSGDKSLGAYQLGTDGSITINRAAAISAYGTIYVLPTEDEWYKAAYFKPDGSGYSTYANGLNTIPAADNGWNYYGGSYNEPWNAGIGAQEQNGTFDMMGNVWEWNETLIDSSYRGFRGGSFDYDSYGLASFVRGNTTPFDEYNYVGFRIASVPEPATLLLFGLGAVMLRRKRS